MFVEYDSTQMVLKDQQIIAIIRTMSNQTIRKLEFGIIGLWGSFPQEIWFQSVSESIIFGSHS